jgi:hypothetical protein
MSKLADPRACRTRPGPRTFENRPGPGELQGVLVNPAKLADRADEKGDDL